MNSQVVRRREGLAAVMAFADGVQVPPHANLDATPSLARRLLQGLLDGVAAFAADPADDAARAKFGRALAELEAVRTGITRIKLRPMVSRHVAFAKTLEAIALLVEDYKEALTTISVAAAQSAGLRAQQRLDALFEPWEAVDSAQRRLSLMEREEVPLPERLFGLLVDYFPGTALAELREGSATMARRDLGLEVGANSAFGYVVLHPVVESILNEERFCEKVRTLASGLTDLDRIRVIATMDRSIELLASTHRILFEGIAAYRAATSGQGDDQTIARRLGKLVSEIYEAAGPVFAWYRLLPAQRDQAASFTKTLGDDTTALVDYLQKGALADAFLDAAKYLRHAPVHGRALEYDTSTESFTISLKSHSERIPQAEFLDRVYAFLETVLASMWALENAIELAGVEVALSDADARYLGFTPLSLFAMWWNSSHDGNVLSYEDRDRRWTVRVEGEEELFTAGVVLAQNALTHADEVWLSSSDEPPLELDYADVHAWLADGEGTHDPVMRLIAFLARAHRDGESLLELSDMRGAVAGVGTRLLDGEVAAVRDARQLRAWSKERGWQDQVDLVDEIIATLRGGDPAAARQKLGANSVNVPAPGMPKSRNIRIRLGGAH